MTTRKYCLLASPLLTLLIETPAWSLQSSDPGGTLHGTEVGNPDVVVEATEDLNSAGNCGTGNSKETEECWAENVLGTELSIAGKNEPVRWYWTNASNENTIAFSLEFGPGHNIVKNAQIYVLLQNVVEGDWGVRDLDNSVLDGKTLNLGCKNYKTKDDPNCLYISHVTEFDGTKTVCEPQTHSERRASQAGLPLSEDRSPTISCVPLVRRVSAYAISETADGGWAAGGAVG